VTPSTPNRGMKRAREADADYEVDRWTVEWCLKYERLMAGVTAAHGNVAQLLILDAETAVLAQDGQDRFAA